MVRPVGRPPTGRAPLKVRLSERDRLYVDSMIRVMDVSYSEFFAMVLEATRSETIRPVDQQMPEGARQ